MDGASPDPRNQYYNLKNTQQATDWLSLRHTNGIPGHCGENQIRSTIKEDMEKHLKRKINALTWHFGIILWPLPNADTHRSYYSSINIGIFFVETTCSIAVIAVIDKQTGQRGHFCLLLRGCVSQRLGTTKFMNLNGWNRFWSQSRFSHLDQHSDRLHFTVKKLQYKKY